MVVAILLQMLFQTSVLKCSFSVVFLFLSIILTPNGDSWFNCKREANIAKHISFSVLSPIVVGLNLTFITAILRHYFYNSVIVNIKFSIMPNYLHYCLIKEILFGWRAAIFIFRILVQQRISKFQNTTKIVCSTMTYIYHFFW